MATWSPQQDAALLAVDRWLKDPGDQQVFRLFGFAGTGKTTLAKHLAEGVDGSVYFGAYTGKAAHVLRQKGCPGASTIHSLIYSSKEKSRRRLKELEYALSELRSLGRGGSSEAQSIERDILRERESLSQPAFKLNTGSVLQDADLVVIDECSMVDGRMGEDLLYFRKPVLVLGDPAQLPPVAGGGFFTDHTPDIMLTDIHRQAKDNPIIRMATIVREGGRLELGDYGSSRVIEKAQVTSEMAMEADQILVGRNKTRRSANLRARSLLGRHGDAPVPEDKLVCLRNNHDKGLLNGALWEVEGVGEISEDRVVMDLKSYDSDDTIQDVEAHAHYFLGSEDKLMWWERKSAEEFDYGYALTVHKSQGSQWDDVFMFDEGWCFREDKNRWLYTGITRAAERVTVVKT